MCFEISRRQFYLGSVLILLALFLAGFGVTAPMAQGALQPERIILNITENPATSQAVTWRTAQKPAGPKAQIVVSTGLPDFDAKAVSVVAKTESVRIDGVRPVYYHSVVFESLKPDTVYAYRVGSDGSWSEWNQFRTAVRGAGAFSFVYMGDPQNDIESKCSRVFREAQRKAPTAAFWLFVGDIVNHGESDSQWGEFFSALGWIARTTSMALLPGNHEYMKSLRVTGPGITYLWRPQFTLPENGPEGVEETAYYFDYQDVRFILLDGNDKLEDQSRWIRRVLADNPMKWTIVAIHHPFYSTADNRDNPYHRMLFLRTFDQFNVDLVLQGHDHTYGRTYRVRNGKRSRDRGTVYVATVSGSKQYREGHIYSDIMAKTGSELQLFQVITVDGDRLEFSSYRASGELFDSFSLEK